MTNIESTIDANLPYTGISPRELETYVRPVVDALTEREYQLSDQITAAVVREFRVSPEDVRVRLEGIGMAVRPAPEPEPAPVVVEAESFLHVDELQGEDGKGKVKNKDRIDSLERTVGKLTEVVEGLANLAQRHLGARS